MSSAKLLALIKIRCVPWFVVAACLWSGRLIERWWKGWHVVLSSGVGYAFIFNYSISFEYHWLELVLCQLTLNSYTTLNKYFRLLYIAYVTCLRCHWPSLYAVPCCCYSQEPFSFWLCCTGIKAWLRHSPTMRHSCAHTSRRIAVRLPCKYSNLSSFRWVQLG